ncbi:Gfo/Idh/MocA family protein [Rhizobium sp. A37_96]
MTKLIAGIVGHYDAICHLEALDSSPEVDRIVVCDLDARQFDTLKGRFAKLSALYRDLEEMLLHEKVDVVCVGMSDEQDLERATIVLNAAVNLILAKPFAEDLAAAEAVVHLAAQVGVKVMVTQEARFRPRFMKIRKMIENGFFGEIIHIRLGGALLADERVPGDLWIEGVSEGASKVASIQEIDLLRFLMDEEIVGVSAISDKLGPSPTLSGGTVCALFQFAGGCIGQTMIGTDNRRAMPGSKDDEFRLIGSKGMAVGYRAYADGFNAWTPLPDCEDEARLGALAALKAFVGSLASGVQLPASGEEALRSLQLRKAVDRAVAAEPHTVIVP